GRYRCELRPAVFGRLFCAEKKDVLADWRLSVGPGVMKVRELTTRSPASHTLVQQATVDAPILALLFTAPHRHPVVQGTARLDAIAGPFWAMGFSTLVGGNSESLPQDR